MGKKGNIARGCPNLQGNKSKVDLFQVGNCNKLNVHDWLYDVPDNVEVSDIVEVRFKNTRKGFYLNLFIKIIK